MISRLGVNNLPGLRIVGWDKPPQHQISIIVIFSAGEKMNAFEIEFLINDRKQQLLEECREIALSRHKGKPEAAESAKFTPELKRFLLGAKRVSQKG